MTFAYDNESVFLKTKPRGRRGSGQPLLSQAFEIQLFYFLSRPRRSSKKFQTGRDARIVSEAPDSNPSTHLFPAVLVDEMIEYHLKSLSVERII
jgi:hypothetical protein